jgi:eukaryotic-like serine/threonine-protein kinase
MQNLESWTQTYPRDWLPFAVLAGWGTQGTGQYEKGIHAAEESLRLNPDTSFSYVMAIHHFFLNRFAEVAGILQQAAARKLEIPEFLITRYYLAFFNGDNAGMEREIVCARGEHVDDWMSHNQAMVLARSGQMRPARFRCKTPCRPLTLPLYLLERCGERGSASGAQSRVRP